MSQNTPWDLKIGYGKNIFGYRNFGLKTARGSPDSFFSKPTQARKHKSEIRWFSKTNLICKELGLVVDIWWWYMAAVVVYGSGGNIWIWIGGGIWIQIGGGIWIWIQSGGG